MSRLAFVLVLLLPIAVLCEEYKQSGVDANGIPLYFDSKGKAYHLKLLRKRRTVKTSTGKILRSEFFEDKTYVPVTIKPKQHDSIESIHLFAMAIDKAKLEMLRDERKKALIHRFALEVAERYNLGIDTPNMPQMEYGFSAADAYRAQFIRRGATSAIGVSLAQTSSTTQRNYFNPDLSKLLLNEFGNATKRHQDTSDAILQGMGAMTRDAVVGQLQLEEAASQRNTELETITRDTQKLLGLMDKIGEVGEKLSEATKTRTIEETTTTTTTEPRVIDPRPEGGARVLPPQKTSEIAKCAVCHSGGDAKMPDFTQKTFSPDLAEKARLSVLYASGQIDGSTLEDFGYSADPNKENHLHPMPRNSSGGVDPLNEKRLRIFLEELKARTAKEY